MLPLDKARPAINALDSFSSCLLKSLTNITYPISHLYVQLLFLKWILPSVFLGMLRSLPLKYCLILHLPLTLCLSIPSPSQSKISMDVFTLNSLHFFVSYSFFSQLQSGFHLHSITLSAPIWYTDDLCVAKYTLCLIFKWNSVFCGTYFEYSLVFVFL